MDFDRPSRHGAILGAALAQLADAGRRAMGTMLPDPCATCAFRPGAMPNQMASTGLAAFKCAVGVDPDPFGCHHGLALDGQPARLCSGYEAARHAPFAVVKEISARLSEALAGNPSEADAIREAFDAWVSEIDPDLTLDAYQMARAYLRHQPPGQP